MPENSTNPAQIGVVSGLTGEAYAESASGLRQLEPGSPIYQGEELVTGGSGNVEVRFNDDTLLSQGTDSRISLDDYVFDDSGESASDFMVNIAEGTFRMVTGKIAEQNPERFKVGTPLATIGIRGTITVHEVTSEGEKHGVEEIHSGKALIVQSNITGAIRQIGEPMGLVDVTSSGILSQVRPLTMQEFNTFREIAPENIQQEQEIDEQRQEKVVDEQLDEPTQDDPAQEDQQTPDQEELPQDINPGGEVEQESPEMGSVIDGHKGITDPGKEILAEKKDFNGLRVKGEPPEIKDKFEPPNEAEQVRQQEEDQEEKKENEQKINAEELLDEQEKSKPQPKEEPLYEDAKSPQNTESESTPEPDDTPISYAIITGTAGDDTLTGTADSNTMYGLQGNDQLHGMAASDILYGAAGDDTLYGDDGADILNGGTGNDTLDGGLSEYESPGSVYDFDFASYADATGSVTVDLSAGTSTGADGNDTLVNIEGIIGSNHNDELIGDGYANKFKPMNGSDDITGGGGEDWIIYDNIDGKVKIELDTAVEIFNSSGTSLHYQTIRQLEHAQGSAGNDTIIGTTGANILKGSSGNDTIDGAGGNDSLYGEDGNDTLIGNTGNDTLDGGAGIDTADYSYHTSTGIKVSLETGIATVVGGTDEDTLVSIEKVIGTNLADTITSGSGNCTINTGDGDDKVIAKSGTASFDGGSGTDILSYAASGAASVNVDLGSSATLTGSGNVQTISGFEVLVATTGNDTLIGTSGDDRIYAEAGNDTLIGGDGIDTLWGSNGNDTIFGGAGNDTLDGGIGDDFISSGNGVDSIDAGTGTDTISYAYAGNGVNFSLNPATTTVTVVAVTDIDTFTGIENAVGSNYGDTITASNSGSTITGEGGNDTLIGGTSSDLLSGGNDIDTLIGNAGNDKLLGDGGNDILIGNLGLDTLNGGTGIDTADYSYHTSTGIKVSLETGIATVTGGTDQDTLISIEKVIGTDNADTFTSGTGDDSIIAGDGDDIIYARTGTDFIDGGTGTDVLSYYYTGTSGVNADMNSAATLTTTGDVQTLSGIEAIVGTAGDDVLTASSTYNNTLNGDLGDDHFFLKTGTETRIYWKDQGLGHDTIDNFTSGEDKLYFEPGQFSNTATLKTVSATYDGSNGSLGTNSACFVFDDVHKQLWYDSNGDLAGGEDIITDFTGSDDVAGGDIVFS